MNGKALWPVVAAGLVAVLLLSDLPAAATGDAQVSLPPRRRVYAPSFSGEVDWAESGLFWFGRVDPPGAPGQNYADVRIAYTAEELAIYVNVEDYYVWYDKAATGASDLTAFDAVAVYLDTDQDGAAAPQPDDYLFLSGLRLYEDEADYRRQARGTGAGWDFDWAGTWSDGTWASWWCNPGPNSNDCGIDFGWWTRIYIPWEAVGRDGPPDPGAVWGLAVSLYDRDDAPSAGILSPEHWPETSSPDAPSTWGELAFGLSSYEPPPAAVEGTTVVRRGLGDTIVADAWVGGGGGCSGGHEGDPEHDNYGGDTGLYVANQQLIADFPCFSKSFLRFDLGEVPADKAIISATLTLHHWGNADPTEAQPSLIWLFTVDGGWEEYGLTWNNAPLARENLTASWVDPLPGFPGWPGVPYGWDATEAVAEAHAADEPLNLALYSADMPMHSSKYFSSSETGDWNAVGRPTLTVVWGSPAATVEKEVWPVAVVWGGTVTYTLSVVGSGSPLTLTDDLPAQVAPPGPIQVSGGRAEYLPDLHRLVWSGVPGVGDVVTVTAPFTVVIGGPRAVSNTVVLSNDVGYLAEDAATFIVDPIRCWMPVALHRK